MLFRDFIPFYMDMVGARSYTQIERKVKVYLVPLLGEKDISKIDYNDLYKVMRRHRTKGPLTNLLKSILSGIFHHAERLGYRPQGSNPAKFIPNAPVRKRRRYMTDDEALRIAGALQVWEKQDLRAVAGIYLLLYTGARPNEIISAKWTDIQGDVLHLAVHKTDRYGDDRRVFLPPQAMAILNELPRDDEHILRRLTVHKMSNMWRSVCKSARVENLRLYDLRHTFASAALSAGYSLAQIGELLGHKSPVTTMRYAHLEDRDAKKVAADTACALGRKMNPLGASVSEAK